MKCRKLPAHFDTVRSTRRFISRQAFFNPHVASPFRMHTLYHALLAQHSRQLTAMQCAGQTIARLHQYFEDVVLENNLSALVVESLPLVTERPLRDVARVRDVGRAARHSFFFIAP